MVIRLQTGQVEVSPQDLIRQSNGRFVTLRLLEGQTKANINKRRGTKVFWTIMAQHDTCTVHIVYEAHSILLFLMCVVCYFFIVLYV